MSSNRTLAKLTREIFMSDFPLSQQTVASLNQTSRYFNFFNPVKGIGSTYRLMQSIYKQNLAKTTQLVKDDVKDLFVFVNFEYDGKDIFTTPVRFAYLVGGDKIVNFLQKELKAYGLEEKLFADTKDLQPKTTLQLSDILHTPTLMKLISDNPYLILEKIQLAWPDGALTRTSLLEYAFSTYHTFMWRYFEKVLKENAPELLGEFDAILSNHTDFVDFSLLCDAYEYHIATFAPGRDLKELGMIQREAVLSYPHYWQQVFCCTGGGFEETSKFENYFENNLPLSRFYAHTTFNVVLPHLGSLDLIDLLANNIGMDGYENTAIDCATDRVIPLYLTSLLPTANLLNRGLGWDYTAICGHWVHSPMAYTNEFVQSMKPKDTINCLKYDYKVLQKYRETRVNELNVRKAQCVKPAPAMQLDESATDQSRAYPL